MVGEKYGVSRATITRLLRIDTLIYELKERIDDDEFGIYAGVELSYLPKNEQEIVDDVMREYEYKLDLPLFALICPLKSFRVVLYTLTLLKAEIGL
jgi:ParB family chromosome partitioning protein